jgi:hypothetical protein
MRDGVVVMEGRCSELSARGSGKVEWSRFEALKPVTTIRRLYVSQRDPPRQRPGLKNLEIATMHIRPYKLQRTNILVILSW